MDEKTARLIARSNALGCWLEEVAAIIHEAGEEWHVEVADKLRNLEPAAALRLAVLLVQMAGERQTETERQLWRKVERAAGYEPGSLTGKPGVKQKVFL
jgi:hypothetical protein